MCVCEREREREVKEMYCTNNAHNTNMYLHTYDAENTQEGIHTKALQSINTPCGGDQKHTHQKSLSRRKRHIDS